MNNAEHTPSEHQHVSQKGRGQPPRSAANATSLPPGAAWLVHLQRTVGNQAVNRLLRQYASQPNVSLTPVDETPQLDTGATAANTRIIQHLDASTLRPPSVKAMGPPTVALTRPEVGSGPRGGPISETLATRIQSQRGGGSPLTGSLRRKMETALGSNFGGVVTHTDSEADSLNRSLNATAFTTGSDIFFRHGAFQPGSTAGDQLLAHELTHVVQQRGMSASGPMSVAAVDSSEEKQAEASSSAALSAFDGSRVGEGMAQRAADNAVNQAPQNVQRQAVQPIIQRSPVLGIWEGVEIALTAAIVAQEQYGISEHGLHASSDQADRMNDHPMPKNGEYSHTIFSINAKHPITRVELRARFKVHWQGNNYGEIGAAYVSVESDHTEFLLSTLEARFTAQHNLPDQGADPREWPIRWMYTGTFNPFGNGDYAFNGKFEVNAFGGYHVVDPLEVIDHSLISFGDPYELFEWGLSDDVHATPPPLQPASPSGASGSGGTTPAGPPQQGGGQGQ